MELRILDYLTNIEEFNGVSFSANLKCTCGATEFQFLHTGKQTKGIFAPFIVKKEHQLILKAVCHSCKNSIIVYDSVKDGANSPKASSAHEFVPFVSNKLPNQFSVVIKYNYFPEKIKIGEVYSNQFENCFIYIIDKNGREGKTLIEE